MRPAHGADRKRPRKLYADTVPIAPIEGLPTMKLQIQVRRSSSATLCTNLKLTVTARSQGHVRIRNLAASANHHGPRERHQDTIIYVTLQVVDSSELSLSEHQLRLTDLHFEVLTKFKRVGAASYISESRGKTAFQRSRCAMGTATSRTTPRATSRLSSASRWPAHRRTF